jgi:hypothetical protein
MSKERKKSTEGSKEEANKRFDGKCLIFVARSGVL